MVTCILFPNQPVSMELYNAKNHYAAGAGLNFEPNEKGKS